MKAVPVPSIKIRWVRGMEDININSALVILALGIRGSGKSVLLEAFAEHYLSSGNNVFDMFGASSGEGLAWLRSPWVEQENLPVLLVRGDNLSVTSSWSSKSWKDVALHDLEANRIVISATPLYEDKDEEFRAAGSILDLLFQRFGWSKYIYLLCREASSLFYSRLKLRHDMLAAKSEGSYLLRESRHHGISLGLDTQKLTAVDSDFRVLCDYIFFKSQGIWSLPREWWFLYGYFNPTWIRNMRASQFAVISRRGSLGVGLNDLPSWHKRAREHILKALAIDVDRGEKEKERETLAIP